MASLTVERLHEPERAGAPILRELENFLDRTQRRAFDLFNQRGSCPGADLDDWLQAEREIVWSPQSELTEDEKEMRIQVAAPGLEPKQIHVTALPESIIVKGESAHKHEGGDGSVQFCEFSEKALFRRFELDNQIDIDRVSATLDNGMLRIVAPKTKSSQGRQVAASRS
jgi:HSP20 family protein